MHLYSRVVQPSDRGLSKAEKIQEVEVDLRNEYRNISSPSNDVTSVAPTNGTQVSPNTADNGINGAAGLNAGVIATAVGGRKRPLLAGGPRTSMTPTKRTVMSLLARARAAQAKQLPATFPRAANPLQDRSEKELRSNS
ncbi:hypothetical protein NQ318_000857 [Aromia moschata]|uniref:Uncharacterized protein n=1 Tax=Aromia moschata TaxID=1265417 RepID=A0AAV8XQK4_9CUCU|nr:hypothetical protein NQ318_000857 [Aromia moschata]